MTSRTIGMRLTLPDFRIATEKAKRRGMKLSNYARALLLADLDAHNQEPILESIKVAHAELQLLREELMRLAVVLLCDAGKCKQSDAKTWVIENMGHPLNVAWRQK